MTRYVDPPPKSPSRLAGEVRPFRVLAEAGERAGDADVVEVVAGGLGQRAGLAPAGHPAVDELRVACPAVLGPQAEALGGAGAHPLDQHVGPLDEVEHEAHARGRLQVDLDARAAAVQNVDVARRESRTSRPFDTHHVGSEVGQDHARMWSGPDAGQLDDPDAAQRPGALPQLVGHAHDPGSRRRQKPRSRTGVVSQAAPC